MIVFVLMISACNSSSEPTNTVMENATIDESSIRVEGRTGYSETLCDLVIENADFQNIQNDIETVLFDSTLYVITTSRDYSTGEILSTNLYNISIEGTVLSQYQLDIPPCSYYVLLNDRIACIASNRVYFVSTEGEIIGDPVESELYPMAACTYDDGYVLAFMDKIIQYDFEGNEVARIENSEFGSFSPYCDFLFEIDDKLYLVSCPGFEYDYYEVEFSSGYCQYICNNRDYDIELVDCNGEYIFDSYGEYKFNPLTGEKTLLAEWNNINERPGGKPAQGYRFYYTFGDNMFIEAYVNSSETACIQIYQYDNRIDYSDAIQLSIGGIGLRDDYQIQSAVYQFNSSHDEYRMNLMEYSIDGYTAQDDVERNAYLMSEFQKGNSPDIFYGNIFDYEYFGNHDMVIDLLPYIQSNENFCNLDFEDSVWDIVCVNNHCYQLFTSFHFNGYWGKSEILSQYTEMTYDDMFSLANPNGIPFASIYNYDIANLIIYNSIHDFIDDDGSFLLTRDELDDILEVSLNYGIPSSSDYSLLGEEGFDKLRGESSLMTWYPMTNLLWYDQAVDSAGGNLCYLGLPSVYGSAHNIAPRGNVAVSASSDYPEACVEFLSYLFTDECQDRVILDGMNSVLRNKNEQFWEYAMNHDSIPSSRIDYLMYLSDTEEVSDDVVESFRTAINTVDTLEVQDWNIYLIIKEEIYSFDFQGKPFADVADSLYSRLELYVNEHYH